ncbi:hypothetical protein [Variovorax sp. JS1663]|uniref:hypothetical protein n=1 Tax=Variovorax sp. JS1663 TaxID=1851577 RepID=UPI00117D9A7A|nr:hypothetical protein [Variovorax sp. JS1663]
MNPILNSVVEWLAPALAWLAEIGAASSAVSIVVFGITFGAAAIFCIVFFLIAVIVIAGIVIFGMRSKDPTEW